MRVIGVAMRKYKYRSPTISIEIEEAVNFILGDMIITGSILCEDVQWEITKNGFSFIVPDCIKELVNSRFN